MAGELFETNHGCKVHDSISGEPVGKGCIIVSPSLSQEHHTRPIIVVHILIERSYDRPIIKLILQAVCVREVSAYLIAVLARIRSRCP